jgi:hypothetical protein
MSAWPSSDEMAVYFLVVNIALACWLLRWRK